jgi:beta-glucanase (GH16 family)
VSLYNRRSDGYPESVDISTGPEWGADPSSQPLHAWTYGYFEARMRVTDAKGAWGAFWLTSLAHAYGNNCPDTLNYELDIFEQQGDEPNTYYGTQHRNTGNDCGASDPDGTPPVWPELSTKVQGDWHTYAVKWTPLNVSYYFDGKQVGGTQATLDSGDQPMLMLLTMQACGWDDTNSCGSSTPDTLETDVDSVQVWQQ